jgi:hypothetical protein
MIPAASARASEARAPLRTRFLFRVCVLAAALAAPCIAQPITFSELLQTEESMIRPPRTAGNAAWAYIKAWDTLPTDDDARNKFARAIGERPKPGAKLTNEQREQLALHRAYIDGLLHATSMDHCDWGPGWEHGMLLLLPHLGQLRNSTRALGLDARRCAEDGSSSAAAERVAAMFRMSAHASTDAIVISSQVGCAIGYYASIITDELIQQDQLTPTAARTIRHALRQVRTKDIYNAGAAIDNERRIVVDWLRRECQGPDAGKFLAQHLSIFEEHPMILGIDSREVLFFMDETAIGAGLDRAERYFDAVERAWNKPAPIASLEELELEAREGQFGLIAAAIAHSYVPIRRTCENVERTFERLDRRLSVIIEQADAAPRE